MRSSRAGAVYILFRLILGLVLLFLASMAAGQGPAVVNELWSHFKLAAVLFLVMGVSAALLPRFGQRWWFPWSQLVVDAFFATALISFSGGPESTFIPLYFLNIVAAAWLLGPRGPVVVAALDAVAFLGLMVVRGAPYVQELAKGDPFRLYLQVTLLVFAFFLVGLLSALLSANVRRARAALADQVQVTRKLKERHDLVLDRIDIGVVLTDGEGLIRSANPSALRLLGSVEGQQLEALFPCQDRRWEQVLSREDEHLTLQCSRMPLVEGGELVLIEDVTRMREMEAAIAREERLSAVGRLAAGLAHEIRNPLASLSGSVQLLKELDENPLHDIVLREVNRLNELVEDFLDSARPVRLDADWQDASAIVDEVVATFRNDIRYRGRRLVWGGPPRNLKPIRIDGGRFRQVLWNLLLNAAQATDEKGTIQISLEQSDEEMIIEVRDDGVGIPAEARQKIFDPFYTTRSGGTGLGLANVERILRAHGGFVELWSEPGRGTSFRLHFPRGGPPVREVVTAQVQPVLAPIPVEEVARVR